MMLITPGKKLHQLLKQHGDFGALEVQVKKIHRSMFEKQKAGGWFTRNYLATQAHWTKYRG